METSKIVLVVAVLVVGGYLVFRYMLSAGRAENAADPNYIPGSKAFTQEYQGDI